MRLLSKNFHQTSQINKGLSRLHTTPGVSWPVAGAKEIRSPFEMVWSSQSVCEGESYSSSSAKNLILCVWWIIPSPDLSLWELDHGHWGKKGGGNPEKDFAPCGSAGWNASGTWCAWDLSNNGVAWDTAKFFSQSFKSDVWCCWFRPWIFGYISLVAFKWSTLAKMSIVCQLSMDLKILCACSRTKLNHKFDHFHR